MLNNCLSRYSSTMEGSKRRRFISFVNRNLERALAVNTPAQGRVQNNTNDIITEENALFETSSEETIAAITAEQERRLRALHRLNQLLLAVPRAMRRRAENSHILQQIRETLAGLRVDEIPEALLQQINDLI